MPIQELSEREAQAPSQSEPRPFKGIIDVMSQRAGGGGGNDKNDKAAKPDARQEATKPEAAKPEAARPEEDEFQTFGTPVIDKNGEADKPSDQVEQNADKPSPFEKFQITPIAPQPEEVLVHERGGALLSITDSGESTDERIKAYIRERGPHATNIDLSHTRITDGGLKVLKDTPNLAAISLEHTDTSDAGVKTLSESKLNKLKEINLHGTTVGDKGAEALSKMIALQKLNLNDTNVSCDGAKSLSALKNLEVLTMDYSPVSDAGIASMKGMNNLRSLSLKGTPITDASVKDLAQFKNLMLLDLADTHLSTEKVEWLQRMMPRCVIIAPDGNGPAQARPPFPGLNTRLFNRRHDRQNK